jgi:RNA polymerase sigma-70 factor (ECF subfamily)
MTPPTAAFTDLLRRHRGVIHKIAFAYARDREDREDLEQEIAGELWRAWPRYDPARPFSTWMYRVALNVAISGLRRRGARPVATVPIADVDAPAPTDADGADARVLLTAIHAEPPLDRALLLLVLEERSQREIADVLGLTETNVATRLSRLKQRLRERFTAPPSPGADR